MNQSDLTSTVMKKVVRYEKKRIFRFLFLFVIILLFFLCVGVISVKEVLVSIFRDEVPSLLSLYFTDRDTFFALWHEALVFVWSVIPRGHLLIGVGSFFIIVVIYLGTKKIRRIVARRRKEMDRYR